MASSAAAYAYLSVPPDGVLMKCSNGLTHDREPEKHASHRTTVTRDDSMPGMWRVAALASRALHAAL
jgi:hypothetical protein